MRPIPWFPPRALALSAALCAAPLARVVAQAATPAPPAGASADSSSRMSIPFATRDLSLPTLRRLIDGITVTPRVLLVGVNPDDVDPALIAWLARGHHVETGFLALTRGEAGQNFGGPEGGSTLGVIRVDEALAARRIDGGRQFFTRAIDPGPVTTAAQVFNTWPRDEYVGDMVSVIRSFRPQVIIAMIPPADSIAADDGQHQALALLAADAFAGAADVQRYPSQKFGMPWTVDELYGLGPGLRIETASIDTAAGVTYQQIGMAARAVSRSQGLTDLTKPRPSVVSLRRVASVGSLGPADTSLFAGVDTTFARLTAGDTGFVARKLALVALHADSARRMLATVSRRAAAPQLAQVVKAVTGARDAAARCKHPAADAALVVKRAEDCDARELDLDAALDVMRQRAVDALLSAAGVMLEATADRELVATSDSATVTVTLANHGSEPVTLADVTTNGRRAASSIPVVVFPDSIGQIVRRIASLDEPRPWWITQHGGGGYEKLSGFIDGLDRTDATAQTLAALGTRGIDVPEDIRRMSDATVTLSVEGTTFRTSIGPILYRYADAQLGLQERQLAGVPDVTFNFGRALEWLPSGKPVARVLHVRVESHADSAIEVGFAKQVPKGIELDTMPKEFMLAPHEARDLYVPIHGMLTGEYRVPFVVSGARADGTTYLDGYQTIQRSYLPPIRVFRNSGTWLQPVSVNIPPKLDVLYVPDASDDIRSSLTQIGVAARELSPDELLAMNLSLVSTVVLGPHALETHPELAAQVGRLLDFVRRGGTLVVQRGDSATLASGLFPYPIRLGTQPGRVFDPDAPVAPVGAGERLLSWPNRITPHDWNGWVLDRAELVPTDVDPRYSRVITMHDKDAPPTANTILTARIGKGMLIYTTLMLDQQIEGAVPGAMRLLVNLLSAGLAPAPR